MPRSLSLPLSPFALSFAREVLAELARARILLDRALSQRPHGMAAVADIETLPLADRLGAEYRGVPSASTMTEAEIAACIEAGRDPWAEDLHGRPHKRMISAPLSAMTMALRILAQMPDEDDLRRLGKNGALTAISMPSRTERTYLHQEAQEFLTALSRACKARDIVWENPAIRILGADTDGLRRDHARERSEFESALNRSIARGKAVWAVTGFPHDLPDNGYAVADRVFPMPTLSEEMVLELLRVTHSVTGEIAENALRERLPSDDKLASLPPPLIEHAFAGETTFEVAERLSRYVERRKPTSGTVLDDMALPTSLRDDLEGMIADLRAWLSGSLDWSDVSSSLCLSGPPGTGKTLLASALAGSAGIPLVATSYAECQRHGHQGDALRALHDAVEKAMTEAPAVILIDELDSFMVRGGDSHSARYNVGMVNGLLEQLTRLNEAPGVLLIGATNHPERVDPAILRSGRFDRHHTLREPDQSGIRLILMRNLGGSSDRIDLAPHAVRLSGCSGATVAAVARDAMSRARREGATLREDHLDAAIQQMTSDRSDEHVWRIAVHEAGHVVVNWHLTGEIPNRVRITPHGGEVAGAHRPVETLESAHDRIAALLAGRAAERVLIGSVSSGAGDDLRQATELAYNLRHAWALDDQHLLALPPSTGRMLPGTPLGDALDHVLRGEAARAEELVHGAKDLVATLAHSLVEKREISAENVKIILEMMPSDRRVETTSQSTRSTGSTLGE
ncbi:AAA family ATPase [Roseivivax marinus]|uniref:AAA family ATPase n=1 Tax=Roseivivax marinus TaxID=1379903 RepID=UPI001F04924E|nr:AAA family ATPase [Roseivivax marinus]UMA65329.1 AAA family ATPase [Roseivivax marinus]